MSGSWIFPITRDPLSWLPPCKQWEKILTVLFCLLNWLGTAIPACPKPIIPSASHVPV